MLTLAAGLLVLMSATGGGGASTESVGPEAPSPEPSRHLDRRRMGVFVTEAGGPSRRDFSLEGHTVPEALDELEAQYESLWENAELAYASEPAEIEWFITQWPYGASAREYPIGVVLLDEMACRMREGDLGPQRDRLIIRFLRDLDKHIRAPQEGLPSWELMHIISRTVCYPDPVEPGPHIDLAVNLFRELTTFHSEAVRLAACNELLTIGMFCSLERQRSLIALVKGRMSEVATPRNSFPCGDDLSWESLEWRMREYEYRSFPLAIVRTSFVSEARYREFPTATAEELLDAFAGGGPLGAEVYLATNTIVQNPEHRFALMTKGLEYARQHPKDCRTLVNCIL
ncbi:MAG: hypothetical protein GY851_14700, partial [bacterium]|nr:hypothetical protein [bacterium]